MYVRRKPNKSGSFTVQVLDKDPRSRLNKVVKTLGTSSDEKELVAMEREAKDYIFHSKGPALPMDYRDPFEDRMEDFLAGLVWPTRRYR